jgi:MIP family channel proteins
MSSQPTITRRVAAEFFGTFVFVLVGAGSALGAFSSASGISLIIGALANGIGLAVAVSLTMGVSGGALNPAVTIGLYVSGKLHGQDVIPYILAQLVGATAAGGVLVVTFPSAIGNAVKWGAPTLNILTVSQGLGLEAAMTFVLMMAVYGTAVDARAPKIGGLAIGLAVLTDVLVGGPYTGAAMNPARAMGPMIAGAFFPSYWWIYWVGPVIGAVVAALLYKYLLEATP